jgi:hypothetical protein
MPLRSFFFSTFIMLCVEDARLRKRGRTMQPSATEPMPSDGESAFNTTVINAERATTLINNILANGFTVQHLEKMGVTSSSAAAIAPKRDYEPGPPNYKA